MNIKLTKLILILVIAVTIIIIGAVLLSPKSPKRDKITNINHKDMPSSIPINSDKKVRKPAVAGQFYPLVAADLKSMIDEFVNNAKLPEIEENKKPRIIIVPHAGYPYSGQVAAYGFKALQGFEYDSVIVLGSSHIAPFPGVSLYDGDATETPLGQIEVDKDLIHKLTTFNHRVVIQNDVHTNEHSLEVELPFLQKILGKNFKVVFALLGGKDLSDIQNFAESLSQILISNPKTLLVISSDLSHYPSYKDAQYSDTKVINSVLTLDPDNLTQIIQKLESENIKNLGTCACGQAAILVGMYVARELEFEPQLLNYANSGDVAIGEKNRVVGYTSIIFNSKTSSAGGVEMQDVETQNFVSLQDENQDSRKLSQAEQQAALKLARQTVEKEFELRSEVGDDYKKYPIFDQNRGVFVTLHKNGNLRGCIGLIEPITSLGEAIQEMAISASFNDPRFQSLTKPELEDIVVEVSVLTPPQTISDPQTIELGTHGVIVRSGLSSGVFLPQVATETGWDLNQFMGHLCADKAGLAADCWNTGGVDIYTFEAQVFQEIK